MSVKPVGVILGMGLFGSMAAAQQPAAAPTTPAANPNVDFHFRYLNGLDDVGITMTHADEITDFESTRPAWLT